MALSSIPGGLAGVFPVLIGWAATGAPPSGALLFVCALIVVWSPPHFWALALAREDDYRASGIPTPRGRYGDDVTRRLIAGFVAALRGGRRPRSRRGSSACAYAAAALVAAAVLWVADAAPADAAQSQAAAWALFKSSGPYLAVVLAAAVLDQLL